MSANKFTHPFKKAEAQFRKLVNDLPMIVSSVAENEFKGNFRKQGYQENSGVIAWPKRKNDKAQGRALLIKSGRLRRGFKKRPTADTAVVINDVPYAKPLNEGSKKRVNVKAAAYKRKKPNKKKQRPVIYVRAHKRQNNLPARPFMKDTIALRRLIDKRISSELKKLL
jgi:phage gpG-like protein